MYVCLPLFFYFIALGFLYPKINKLFGGCMCVIVLVIFISSHTHILVSFFSLLFFLCGRRLD